MQLSACQVTLSPALLSTSALSTFRCNSLEAVFMCSGGVSMKWRRTASAFRHPLHPEKRLSRRNSQTSEAHIQELWLSSTSSRSCTHKRSLRFGSTRASQLPRWTQLLLGHSLYVPAGKLVEQLKKTSTNEGSWSRLPKCVPPHLLMQRTALAAALAAGSLPAAHGATVHHQT